MRNVILFLKQMNKQNSCFLQLCFDHPEQWCFQTQLGRRPLITFEESCPREGLGHFSAYSSDLGLLPSFFFFFFFSCLVAAAEIQSDDVLAFCYILGIWLETRMLLLNYASLLHLCTSRFWEEAINLQLHQRQWLHRSQQLLC